MAYEILLNASFAEKPSHKPNYTPSKSLRKALKAVRKFFRKSATTPSHTKLKDERVLKTVPQQQQPEALERVLYETLVEECPSDEECENYANELREATNANASQRH